jgi:hypothetical protein
LTQIKFIVSGDFFRVIVMVSEVAPQALAKLAMAAPQALAIATATLHAMATAAAGGDTATGDVMAAMPMAMMAMLIPIAAATTPTAMERALWFATKTERG